MEGELEAEILAVRVLRIPMLAEWSEEANEADPVLLVEPHLECAPWGGLLRNHQECLQIML